MNQTPHQTLTHTVMPAEWDRHERTWMAFPPPNDTFGEEGSASLDTARRAWARVANTVVRYEPVTMVAGPGQTGTARGLLDEAVDVVEFPLDDAWMRDSGPTFVRNPEGGLTAVNWVFNGWGAQEWAVWDNDQHLASRVAGHAAVPVASSKLVNEGGGIHIDGEGTVLLTETVQLDPGRNPDLTKAEVEAEIHAQLGTSKAIWLPQGLTRDYDEFGTRGHVDIVAAFVRPGVVAVHMQNNPEHPDYEVSRKIRDLLAAATDAQGRALEVLEVPAPTVLTSDGGPADWSYINHYVANGVVVLCGFDDPNDQVAAGILGQAYPDRVIELVDARTIFSHGGGIHCITQQQPATGTGTHTQKDQ